MGAEHRRWLLDWWGHNTRSIGTATLLPSTPASVFSRYRSMCCHGSLPSVLIPPSIIPGCLCCGGEACTKTKEKRGHRPRPARSPTCCRSQSGECPSRKHSASESAEAQKVSCDYIALRGRKTQGQRSLVAGSGPHTERESATPATLIFRGVNELAPGELPPRASKRAQRQPQTAFVSRCMSLVSGT